MTTPTDIEFVDQITVITEAWLDGVNDWVNGAYGVLGATYTASAFRTALSAQTLDATLTSLSSLGTTADKFAYTTGIDTWAEGSITAAGRAILDDADSTAQRATLGLVIGTNVQAYDADIPTISASNNWTKSQSGAISTLTDAATIAVDLSLANNFKVTLAGNRTLGNPTNIVAGQSGVIAVTQDATGSRTLAYSSYFKFAGGTAPALSTAANAVDYLSYYVETTTRILIAQAKDIK